MSRLATLPSNQKQFIKGGVIFLLIALFLTSIVLCTYYLLFSTVTTEQLKYFEEVAKDVYSQTPSVLYEVPDDVNVSMDDFSITVSDCSARILGSVTATVEEGKLTFEYNDGNSDRKILTVVITLLILLVLLMFGAITYAIFEDFIKYYYFKWRGYFRNKKIDKNKNK